MASSVLAAALAGGVTVVTPNKRLARTLVARHDAAMVAAGHVTWSAARVLPWQTWLDTLWSDALAARALPDAQSVIAPHAAALVWDRIVVNDSTLLDPRGAAERAADAWRTFHAWRKPGETTAAWARAGIADDAAAFARWAAQYEDALAQRSLADGAQLADRLAGVASRVDAWRTARCLLAGFLELAPQQRRLLDALREAGVAFDEIALPEPRAAQRARIGAPTPAMELAMALSHARERAAADPAAHVGIVIANLDERRNEVLAAAEDLLCPSLAEQCVADAARPYSVSFGTPLADVAIVACALALIEWSGNALPIAEASVALRSPYLPGAEAAWPARADSEGAWRRAGWRDVPFAAAIGALHGQGAGALADRWRGAVPPAHARQAPAAWAGAWRAWLDALGWPGDRALGSGEWQARDAFLHVLGDFATLGSVAPALRRDEAVAALRAAARRTLFQPESPPARIQILGMLEAAGLAFDTLWIAGLSAEHWPPPASPTPLLPLAWQRDRAVPRSDGALALAYARTLTNGFAQAADQVIASHAVHVDGQERAGSALVAAWPAMAADAVVARAGRAVEIAGRRPPLDLLPDASAPPVAAGARVRGGVDAIESQSTCPFQAFARHRLVASADEDLASGLSAQERGSLLHRALAAFWDDVHDHAALCALTEDALRARIAQAVDEALRKVDARRWRSLPAPVARAESTRLGATLHAWLVSVERARPPFTVVFTEAKMQLALGGIELALQIDRVDVVAGGGLAIIDYKSARAPAPAQWFAERPSGTQLGLYALAQRVRAPEQPVVAVAYAELKAGSVKVNGLAAEAALWPALRVLPGVKNVPLRAWSEVEPAWRAQYGAIATDFANGRAAVAPRNAAACRWCQFQSLCRVQRLDDVETSGEGDPGDDE